MLDLQPKFLLYIKLYAKLSGEKKFSANTVALACSRKAFSQAFTVSDVGDVHVSEAMSAENERPFPSFLVPLFQSESTCETILMKMTLICMKMKLHAELIFIRKVSHLDSF